MGKRSNTDCQEFQCSVSNSLIRHSSILDILSKFHETSSRVHRATIKAITECGCVNVKAKRQSVPEDCSYSELRDFLTSHLEGELCETCQEVLEMELGHNLYYFTALCDTLGIELEDVIQNEIKRLQTLGMFNLR